MISYSMRMNTKIPIGITLLINTYSDHIKTLKEKPIIIAIDGHSSCGKSTLSKDLAALLYYKHIDTGAMYRAVTYHLITHNVDVADIQAVESHLDDIEIDFQQVDGACRTFLNGDDIEAHIRGLRVAELVSPVATISAVRHNLVNQQRRMGKAKGIVMDGRDISSVVFPNAELKIFMTADPKIRAERRYQEMITKGSEESYNQILENLKKRDHIDSTRKDSPLIQVADAHVIDTSNLSRQEQLDQVMQLAISLIS